MAPSLRYIKKNHSFSLVHRPLTPHFEAQIAQGDLQPAFRILTGGHVWSEGRWSANQFSDHEPTPPPHPDRQPSFRNAKNATTPMANQGTLQPFPRDKDVQMGLEGL